MPGLQLARTPLAFAVLAVALAIAPDAAGAAQTLTRSSNAPPLTPLPISALPATARETSLTFQNEIYDAQNTKLLSAQQ